MATAKRGAKKASAKKTPKKSPATAKKTAKKRAAKKAGKKTAEPAAASAKVKKAAKPTKVKKAAKPTKVKKAAKPTKVAKPAKPTKVAKPAKLKKVAKAKPAKVKKTRPAKQAAAKPAALNAKMKQRYADVAAADPSLFAPLTQGEYADAIRVLTEDKRLSEMTKVGRYRVISVEPMTVKPPQKLAGKRLARVVIYDYAGDRCVDSCVNLDDSQVAHLKFSRDQPMLSRDEEAAAISIAMADERVAAELSFGDEPMVAMHYWSSRDTDLAFSRRSAAVIFGRPGARPSTVAVIDLVDSHVAEVIPASQW